MALIVNDRYAGDEAWQEWFKAKIPKGWGGMLMTSSPRCGTLVQNEQGKGICG